MENHPDESFVKTHIIIQSCLIVIIVLLDVWWLDIYFSIEKSNFIIERAALTLGLLFGLYVIIGVVFIQIILQASLYLAVYSKIKDRYQGLVIILIIIIVIIFIIVSLQGYLSGELIVGGIIFIKFTIFFLYLFSLIRYLNR